VRVIEARGFEIFRWRERQKEFLDFSVVLLVVYDASEQADSKRKR
tara:strand:+ start:748 stop:882 length:135 start_codon:yes stop_codon:yes gene_type:complete